jgi:hypothetical protein
VAHHDRQHPIELAFAIGGTAGMDGAAASADRDAFDVVDGARSQQRSALG